VDFGVARNAQKHCIKETKKTGGGLTAPLYFFYFFC